MAPQRNCVEQRVLRQGAGRVERAPPRGRIHAGNAVSAARRGRARKTANGPVEIEELRARVGHENGAAWRATAPVIGDDRHYHYLLYRILTFSRWVDDVKDDDDSDENRRRSGVIFIGFRHAAAFPARHQPDESRCHASHDSTTAAAAQVEIGQRRRRERRRRRLDDAGGRWWSHPRFGDIEPLDIPSGGDQARD